MKTKPYLFTLSCLILLISCAENTMSPDMPMQKSVDSDEITPEMVAISNYVKKNHPKQSRSGEMSMTPYLLNGDTVMYIVNYGDNGGWEVFSNEVSVPMLLMKSPYGHFDLDSIDNSHPAREIFDQTANAIAGIRNSKDIVNDTICSEWKLFNNEFQLYSDANDEKQFLISSEPKVTTKILMPKGGRLITKWDQDSYYNLYTPFYRDETSIHAPVGCVAVALGQFFYHSHYNFGRPVATVTDAQYNSTNNTYSYSGSSSSVWDSFNSNPDKWYMPEYMKPTAIFLGYIGKSINTDYGKIYNRFDDKGIHRPDGSTAQTISDISVNFFKNQTGLDLDIKSADSGNVASVLEKGYPVVVRSSINGSNIGHAYLIDYYESEWTEYYNYYTTSPLPPDAEWPDLYPEITLAELEALFGEIIIEREFSSKTYFKMNWGWGGSQNDTYFDAWCTEWEAGGNKFDRRSTQMYYIK
ncbi:MAG: C10 family peptidase [Staphylococcus sp.]|nr:C10 family peptidase [Staphylococcus sp.]